MIERNEFGYTIDCDKCPNYHNHDSEFFQSAIDEIKELGWKIRKTNDEWEHICPVCAEAKQ